MRRLATRCFSTSAWKQEIRRLDELPSCVRPSFTEIPYHGLHSLKWPQPPHNILLVGKSNDQRVQGALVEFSRHIKSTYPDTNVILEPEAAQNLHAEIEFAVSAQGEGDAQYQDTVDMISTFGGDGTVLHAASLFATAPRVPPVLSFSMGTLGFLGEWSFSDYQRAFHTAYYSGIDKKSMSRVIMRDRLRVGIFGPDGKRIPHEPPFTPTGQQCNDVLALNEVLLHRGALPHMAHITILIGSPPHQQTLTTAIADGFLVSTPTGSTAYSLSSGGSIVHPLVHSLLLTPICPRSLSFRPLVLPAHTPITLRIDAENRGKEIEVSADGMRRQRGLGAGMEVRVVGENGTSGVPFVLSSNGDDYWVGGLNGLLKFNNQFGGDR